MLYHLPVANHAVCMIQLIARPEIKFLSLKKEVWSYIYHLNKIPETQLIN